MAICNGIECKHMNTENGKCMFSGTCVLKQQQAQADAKPVIVIKNDLYEEEKVQPKNSVVVDDKATFNPFQRGNGCMLAGYTFDEIFSHTR